MSCNRVSRLCTVPQVDEVQLTRRFFGVRIPFGSNRTPTCTSSADLGDKPTQRCNLRAQVARARGPSARGQFHPCGSVGGTVSGYQPMSRKASVPPRCGNAGVLSCGSIATPRRHYSPSTYRGHFSRYVQVAGASRPRRRSDRPVGSRAVPRRPDDPGTTRARPCRGDAVVASGKRT